MGWFFRGVCLLAAFGCGGPHAASLKNGKAAPQAPQVLVDKTGLPEGFQTLGDPCGPRRLNEPPSLGEWCEEGRVAGIYRDIYEWKQAPKAGQKLSHTRQKTVREPSQEIYLVGDQLWVKQVACGTCARIMGWAFVGDLRLLSDDQLVELQLRAGLEQRTPLRTADEWRKFLLSSQ